MFVVLIFVFVIDFSLRRSRITLCHMQGFDNDTIKTCTQWQKMKKREREKIRVIFIPETFSNTTQSKQNNMKMISEFQSRLKSRNEQHLKVEDAFLNLKGNQWKRHGKSNKKQ